MKRETLAGTPTNDDIGVTEEILISVSDGEETVLLPPFAITVANVNDSPTIGGVPETSVLEDTSYTFAPDADDIDGDTLTFSISNKPDWASFNSVTGLLTGIPGDDDVGITSNIVISVSDGMETVSLGAFNIDVVNVNDAPVITGLPATKAVEDIAYSFTPNADDADGDMLTFSILNQPEWTDFNPVTGALTGIPENEDVGESDSILISVTDGEEVSYLASFVIEVINTNDAPVISGTPEAGIAEDSPYSFTPYAEDIDGDTLTFSISKMPDWASFDIATGLLSGTPDNDDVGVTSNIVISVSDGVETASLDAFAIEVTNVNDAPTISGAPATKAVQDTAYSFTPEAEDADGDSLIFSIVNQPDWALFSTETGALSGMPDNEDVGITSDIVISVSDGQEMASLASFTIEVTNSNDAPVISGTPETRIAEDSTYSFTPYAEDIDGDTLTFSISTMPDWASFDIATGLLSGTPGNDDVGMTTGIVISVSDGAETASLDAFAIEVTNVNDAPTISGAPATKAIQDTAYSFTPEAEDADGDSLIFSIVNQPDWALFSTETGALSGMPDNEDVGITSDIVISVSDGEEMASLASFTIEVTNSNDAPVISGTPETRIAEDSTYSFTPYAEDIDGDTLTFSINTMPDWASFDIATGLLSGTPDNDDVGVTSNIVISVSDGVETASLDAFAIEVTNVNDAPTISGAPATKAIQDTAYSFTPEAEDADGDSLIFSIVNQPDWALFSTETGALSGMPDNEDVGLTSDIVISVSDGEEMASLASFTIEVTNSNDAPVISGTPETRIEEDSLYSFTPYAEDIDGDTLTFSISTMPDWASFDIATGLLSGTPDNDDVGVTGNIVISVSDGVETASLDAFAIEVTNVNDAPVISGTPGISTAEDSTYTFTPYAYDIDGDTLTFSVSNVPDWMSFSSSNGTLTGTPGNDDVGVTGSMVISVSDGTETVSLEAFAITVSNVNQEPVAVEDSFILTESENGSYSLDVLSNDIDIDNDLLELSWVSTDKGSADIQDSSILLVTDTVGSVSLQYSVSDGNGGSDVGLVTVVISSDDLQAPQIIPPADVEVDATGLFTKVDLGVAVAQDGNGDPLPVSLVEEQFFFKPGQHTLYWYTVDANGNEAEASQRVIVHPQISISKDDETTEGTTHKVSVFLNGDAPDYPLVVPYTVGGSSDSQDHTLVDGEVVIGSGKEGEIEFSVATDDVSEGEETLEITLANSLNLGSNYHYVLTIHEGNVAPDVAVSVAQSGQIRPIVESSSDVVTVIATVTDANQDDTHIYNWINDNAGLANISENENEFIFSPEELEPGIYKLTIEVTDSSQASVSSDIYIEIVEVLATLDSQDSDGDLIPDDQEGFADSDNDGIPDYLDAISECNVIQEQALESQGYLAEGEPGICLRKGVTLAGNQTGGTQLMEDELGDDSDAQNVGGVFDFVAYGLPKAGQSYQIVFPQRLPIPIGAVYRKYKHGSGWVDFQTDENNYLSSAQGAAGYCPPPGDSLWTSGLTEGNWCVQLTIQDGGQNDDDDESNGTIIDPGGVATTSVDSLPVAVDDSAYVTQGGNVQINVLTNDSDADNDVIEIATASANFGTVTVEENELNYQATEAFYGTDTIIYSITDHNGGTAFAKVYVTVDVVQSTDDLIDAESDDSGTSSSGSSGGGSMAGWILFVICLLRLVRDYRRKSSYH